MAHARRLTWQYLDYEATTIELVFQLRDSPEVAAVEQFKWEFFDHCGRYAEGIQNSMSCLAVIIAAASLCMHQDIPGDDEVVQDRFERW